MRAIISVGFTFVAAALIALSLKLPLWQLRMEAPQYQGNEALQVRIYPGAMRGDLNEIKVLNQYIGVHLPATLPQLNWLPVALLAAAGAAAAASFTPGKVRSRLLVIIPTLLVAALLAAAVQAQAQMYAIGHHRDHKTKMVGVADFTPPFLGKARVAQFTVSGHFGWGTLCVAGAIALQLGAAWASRSKRPACASAASVSGVRENCGREVLV